MVTASDATAVMLVDDNPGDRDLVKMAFEDSQVALVILEAGDGREALELLQRLADEGRLPKLAIIDLNMPRMNGWELLDHLTAPSFARMWRVAFSSSTALDDRQRAMASGADAFVTKPPVYTGYVALVETFAGYLRGSDVHPRLPRPI